jgi:exopolyphosphatase / guanosine-5'-triphosphate,3'-diphosphate pyrophosphatase
MRVAAVDIGTNSVLLLVAEVTERGLVAVEEQATVTRLGQGVDRTRVIQDEAIERTNACLRGYAARVRELGASRVAIAGTSALRDATGGERVARFAEAELGAPLRVISGHEEARLTFLGAVSGLDEGADAAKPRVAFDVGGGSTEFVLGARESKGGRVRIDFAESFDVGSVRLTERHLRSDPPSTAELRAASETAGEAFARLPALHTETAPIGIAGTVTTLAAVSLGLTTYDGANVHGRSLTRSEIERIVEALARVPLVERKLVPGLHPGRADVIVAGGLVVLAALRRLGAEAMLVSDRGIRWGLATELASDVSTGKGGMRL